MMSYEEALNQNDKLIKKIASEFKGCEFDDLYQMGSLAIKESLESYDESFNTKFSTYAFKNIRGKMSKYAREDRNIKVNQDSLKLYRAYKKAQEFLEQKYYRIPSTKEICLFMGISEEKLYECLMNCEYTTSLDEKIDEDRSVYEVIGNDETEAMDNKIMIKDALENLTEFEKKLINCRIYKGYTQSQTARALGISQVQVSRYESGVYLRMRKKMHVG